MYMYIWYKFFRKQTLHENKKLTNFLMLISLELL